MEVQAASLIQRATAAANTFVPACLYVFAMGFCSGALEGVSELVVLLVYLVPVIAIVLDGAAQRATYGMRVVRLRFGTGEGLRIGFWWCTARILLGIAMLPCLPISIIVACWDGRHRTLADLICGTAMWHEPTPPDDWGPRGFHVMPLEERQHL